MLKVSNGIEAEIQHINPFAFGKRMYDGMRETVQEIERLGGLGWSKCKRVKCTQCLMILQLPQTPKPMLYCKISLCCLVCVPCRQYQKRKVYVYLSFRHVARCTIRITALACVLKIGDDN